MIRRPPPVGSHHRSEDSDFILDIEGMPNIKCEQAFDRPNNECWQGSRGLVPDIQRDNAHVDDGEGVRWYSNPGETGGSHGEVDKEPANPNAN